MAHASGGQLARYSICSIADIDADSRSDFAADLPGAAESALVICSSRLQPDFQVSAAAQFLITCRDLNGDDRNDLLSCTQAMPIAFSGVDGARIDLRARPDLFGLRPLGMRSNGVPASMGIVFASAGVALWDCRTSLDSPLAQIACDPQWLKAEIQCVMDGVEGWYADDFDGDGVLDLLHIAMTHSLREGERAMHLAAFGSKRNTPLFSVTLDAGPFTIPLVANCVALAGDLDGNGMADIVIGNPTIEGDRSGVIALSGVNGEVIWRFAPVVSDGYSGEYRVPTGVSIAAAGDLNGDGVDEILVGCGGFADMLDDQDVDGAVLVISGRTGRLLRLATEPAFGR